MFGRKLLLCLGLLAACGLDNESAKKRLIDTGNKYYNSGKYKEASIIYRKAIQRDARFGEAYYRLGLVELKQGRFADALRALRRASELQPDNDDAHSKLGDLYLTIYLSDRTKYKQLLTDFGDLADRLLKRNPKSFEGLRMKGFLAVAENKWSEAVEQFRAADAVKANDPNVRLSLAQALVAAGQRAEGLQIAKDFLEKVKTYGPMYDFLYMQYASEKNVAAGEAILKSKVANNPTNSTYRMELAAHHLRMNNRAEMKRVIDEMTANRKDFPKGHRMAGDFYFRINDYESAYQEYEKGIDANPGDRRDYQKRMVELLAIQGRRADAIQLAEKLLAEQKDDAESQALRASLRLQGADRQDHELAVKELQAVIARMPDNPVVRFNLGEALMARGDIEAARVQFSESVKLRSTYLPPMVALGRIHLIKGEFPRALQVGDEVIRLAPRNIQGKLIRTAALMGQMDLGNARKEIENIFALSPENKDAYYLRAMIDYTEKKFKDAEDAFRKLYSATPPDPRGLLGLVEIHMSQGRTAEAKALLDKELASNKDSRTAKLAMANVLVRSSEYDKAIAIYKEMLAKTPESEDLNLRMGECYLRSKRYDESLAYWEKARKINGQNVLPLLKTAVIYEITQQKDKTRPIYEAILKVQPDNAIALNNMAYILAESGTELDQALTYAQRAKQKMPSNPDVADTLGWVYIKKNLSDDAIKIFRDLLNQRPDHVTWRYHLALALFQKGDRLQAKKELETASRNKPNKEEEQKIRDLMARIG